MNKYLLSFALSVITLSSSAQEFSKYIYENRILNIADTLKVVTFTVKDGDQFIENANISLVGYGNKITDADGIAIFEDVAPENDIKYTVSAYNYNDYTDSLTVIDQNINKEVKLTKSIYEVSFTVKANGVLFEGAAITLGSFGTKYSDANGLVTFSNILPNDSIYYEVSANQYSMQTGKIVVVDDHISKEINLVQEKYKVTFVVQLGNDPIVGAEITFSDYGTESTNSDGIARFEDVLPDIGLEYTVRIAGYSDYLSAINVYNEDVVEYVTYTKPSYSVLFIVSAHGQPLGGANVMLGIYGTQVTDNFGYARFINVAQEKDIEYNITADGLPDLTGAVTVIDKDVEEVISVTDINMNESASLKIWPNPTNGLVFIKALQKGTVQILNLNGQIIFSSEVNSDLFTIDLQAYKNGFLFIRYISKNLNITEKLIVQ